MKRTSFFSDKRGVIAVAFGLMFPVLIAAMGVGYDLGQAYMARSRLTQALDAAGLASAGTTGTTSAMETRFNAYIKANYPDMELGTLKGVTFTQSGNDVTVTGTVSVDTSFMKWFGRDTLDVTAEATVHRELQGVEVAMVLDNTGSMSGSKITNLKKAAVKLVDVMAAASLRSTMPDSVKLSLVPYSMTVNVGSTYSTAAWLDKNGQSPVNNEIFTTTGVKRLNLFTAMSTTWGGCVESRASPYDVTEAPPTSSTPATLYVPYFAPDEPDTTNAGYINNYLADVTNSSDWKTRQGYAAKYNKKPKTGTNGIGYQFGPNAGCELKPIVRLTNNFTALKTAINAMTTVGDTNIPFGLMWGWHSISPNAPFSDGVPYGTERYKKIIILMTDGDNTDAVVNNNNQSSYAGIGYIWQNRLGITSGTASQRSAKLDSKMTALCTNAKAAGITIYTIRLENASANPTVIKGCATSPDYFYDVTDSNQLTSVFEAIANSIQNLRLTK